MSQTGDKMNVTIYCTKHLKKGETAGSKAPSDISKITESMGIKPLLFIASKKIPKNIYLRRFKALFSGIKSWHNIYGQMEKDSYVIIQHPNEGIYVSKYYMDYCKKKKNIHFIALIHDLDSIRGNLNLKNQQQLSRRNNVADNEILNKCDYIISHNQCMTDFMIKMGLDKSKIINLDIFDYLVNGEVEERISFDKSFTIAGNLMPGKCKYLYKLLEDENRTFTLHLYGPGFEDKGYKNIIYHGSVPADTLPTQIEGSFGLVWDGDSIDSCTGNSGEYLRYNNPHKTSLYLASNMPVLVWKEAAIKGFVENNHAGIGIGSLHELNTLLDRITEDEYNKMKLGAQSVGERIREGFYCKGAIKKVKDKIGEKR